MVLHSNVNLFPVQMRFAVCSSVDWSGSLYNIIKMLEASAFLTVLSIDAVHSGYLPTWFYTQ